MQQHMYYDSSDLNAIYDSIPVEGLGAGSITGSRMGSLSGALGADAVLPWMTFSAQTETVQNQLNAALAKKGMPPVKVDGKLGPITCAALKYAGMSTGGCQSYGTYPPPGTVPTQQASMFATLGGGGGNTGWIIGGLVVAAGAVGLALYMKRRR